ncbi:VWA domain-containing protein, partial [bacterium]|nr:VWA domain-containing protein [bacterium]
QSLTENKKKSPAPKKAPIHTKIPAPRKIEKERVTSKKENPQTYNREYLEKVPSGRDPWVVLEQTPGVDNDRLKVGGSESGQQTGYFAGGAQPANNAWNYDGVVADTLVAPPPPSPAEPPPASPKPPLPEVASPPVAERKTAGKTPTYYDYDAFEELQNATQLNILIDENKRKSSSYRDTEQTARQGTLLAQNAEGETIGDFPLKHTEVSAEISGQFAKTIVEQQYSNAFQEAIEAVYVFPLPAMAAVNDFVMEVGDQKIVGIVRPREEAERIYQQAKTRGQTASLLTQERSNIFTQNVANIEPGGKVNIKITYFEKLNYERGYYEYIFPMVVGPRYIPGNSESVSPNKNPGGGWSAPTDQVPDADRITPPVLRPDQRSGHDINVAIKLDAGLPIQDMKCVTHGLEIKEESSSRRVIKLKRAASIPNRDLVLRWSVAGDQTQMGVFTHRSDSNGFFTLLMQPPLNPADNQVTPREIIFILDISGSMQGIPIEMSKQVVSRALDRMRAEDIFNIFVFANGNAQLWEAPRERTKENIATAKQFLQTLQGSGGTEMLAGVQRALHATHDSKYLQMYAFLTDGYIGNEDAILKVIKEERGDARFFAFGIGSSVNRYLIDGIGKYGGGVSHVVLPQDRSFALRAVDEFYECIDSPVLVDIELDWHGLPVREVYPRKIGDLFAGQIVALTGRFNRAAKGKAFVKARVGDRQMRYEIQMNLPEKQQAHSALAPVWARYKIEELSEAMVTAAEDQKAEIQQQITDLGIQHRLVTQYTSFVAVDESRVVSHGNPLRILQPVELPKGVSYEGNFGEQPVGQVMKIDTWGVYLQLTQSGKILICHVEPTSVAARSGIKPGAILKSINRIMVHDLLHLNGLLLQTGGKNVQLEFINGQTVLMPVP